MPDRLPMSESQLQSTVVEMARLFGWLVHHDRPARRKDGSWSTPVQGDAGFPDIVACGRGRLVVLELKSEKGRVSPAQNEWLAKLREAGVDARVIRPSDLGSLHELFRGEG